MNKEEIVENIKAYYVNNDIDKIIEYITNLQQENKQLKEENDKLNLIRNKALNWFECPDRNKLQKLLEILKG